jgi:ubiquitin carboxyl-terminal hydrolase 8
MNYNNNQIPNNNFPPLIGLNNIGATCYMNSTLQCLSQTLPLTQFFLGQNNQKYFNNNINFNNDMNKKLTLAYLKLIKELWQNKKGYKTYSPYLFKNTIEEMNSLFQSNQAGDAKDLIIFILDELHRELKSPIMDFQNNNNLNLSFNQYEKKNAFLFFIQNYKKNYSIIADIFFGIKETGNLCLNCKNIYNPQNPTCYNYELFHSLIFPLEKIKNMKYNNINNLQDNNILSIYDCFDYNQKVENFIDNNRGFCNLCQQYSDSIFYSKIYYGPNVLILILDRGKDNIYKVKLDFQENIDLSNYILYKDMNNMIYNLYGVISHIGESGPSAHFVASCKNPINFNWYRFNDSLVNPIFDFQKDIIEFGTPYILFYKKQNYNESFFDNYQLIN